MSEGDAPGKIALNGVRRGVEAPSSRSIGVKFVSRGKHIVEESWGDLPGKPGKLPHTPHGWLEFTRREPSRIQLAAQWLTCALRKSSIVRMALRLRFAQKYKTTQVIDLTSELYMAPAWVIILPLGAFHSVFLQGDAPSTLAGGTGQVRVAYAPHLAILGDRNHDCGGGYSAASRRSRTVRFP